MSAQTPSKSSRPTHPGRRSSLPFCLILLAALFQGGWLRPAQADFIVADGFDLFQTDSAQFDFGGPIGIQAFQGVPLGPFDFGGMAGVQNVGLTDTIIARLADADTGGVPGTDTIPIEIVALSLESVAPINIGGGPEIVDWTLASALGSTEDITISGMSGGTFDATLAYNAQFTGQTSGLSFNVPITFTTSGNSWQRSPTGNVIIDGISHLLKGDATEDQDFWPVAVIPFTDGAGSSHNLVSASIPEPSRLGLLALGAAGVLARRWRA